MSYIQISSPDNHSLALAADGRVYTKGRNGFNQLGFVSQGIFVPDWTYIPTLKDIVYVCALFGMSFFTDVNGTFYACGTNDMGQLGFPETIFQVDVPTVVPNLRDVVQVAGRAYTLFLTRDGNVYGCGDNRDKGVNNSNVQYIYTPVQLPISDVVSIATSHAHSLFVLSDGTVWERGGYSITDVDSQDENGFAQILHEYDILSVTASSSQLLFLQSNRDVLQFDNEDGIWETVAQNVVTMLAEEHYAIFIHIDGTVSGTGDLLSNQVIPTLHNMLNVSVEGTNMIFLRKDGTLFTTSSYNIERYIFA